MLRAIKIVLVVVTAAIAATPLPRGAVERLYSRGVYPVVQPRITSASNASSFAWFDVAAIVVGGAVLALWIGRLRQGKKRRLRTLADLVVDTSAIGAVCYLWFLAGWGLNYQREPLRSQLDFQESRITRDALRGLAAQNVAFLNRQYDEAHRRAWPELAQMPAVLEAPFSRAQADLGMSWRAAPGRPKRSLFDFYFTRVSIDGMTDPFFLETLANQSLLPFERPFTVAHEWGHLAGYADESEANFFAWLVCMRAPVPEQYSARISLYGTIANALPPSDRADISGALASGPRDDLRAMAERVRRQVSPVANRTGYALYDRFLKANRVQAGIRSYREVLRLLLGTRFTADGTPVLAAPTQ